MQLINSFAGHLEFVFGFAHGAILVISRVVSRLFIRRLVLFFLIPAIFRRAFAVEFFDQMVKVMQETGRESEGVEYGVEEASVAQIAQRRDGQTFASEKGQTGTVVTNAAVM